MKSYYNFCFALQESFAMEYDIKVDSDLKLSEANLYVGALGQEIGEVSNILDKEPLVKNGDRALICKGFVENKEIINAIQSVLIGNSICPLSITITETVWFIKNKLTK